MKALLILLSTTVSTIAADWRDIAISKLADEQQIAEAMFPQRTILWVSVRDDGTPRDGYAQYVCLVLIEAGLPRGETNIKIRVLNVADLNETLGEAWCRNE